MTASSGDIRRDFPRRHGVEAMKVGRTGGAVGAGWNEKVADGREHVDEPLQPSGRPKALPRPFSSPERQMRILRSVVEMGYSACRQSPSFQSEVWRFRLMVHKGC
jgi:hypothetical protein